MKLHPELARMSVADIQERFLLPAPDLDINDDPDLYRSFFYDSAAVKLERRGARQFLLATLPTADAPGVYAILSALNLYDLDAHAKEQIFALLADPRPLVVAATITELPLYHWWDEIWARVEPLLEHPSPWVRLAVLRVINDIYGPLTEGESLPYLLEFLFDPDPIVREHILYEIAGRHFPDDLIRTMIIPALVRMQRDHLEPIRKVAAETDYVIKDWLARNERSQSIYDAELDALELTTLIERFHAPEPAASIFNEHWGHCSEYYLTLANALQRKGQPGYTFLRTEMQRTDTRRLATLIFALGRDASPASQLETEELLAYLDDKRPEIKACVIQAFYTQASIARQQQQGVRNARRKVSQVIANVWQRIQPLQHDPSSSLREEIMHFAREYYPLQATTMARKALRDPHWQVRQAAADTLGYLGVKEAEGALLALLHSDARHAVRLAARLNIGFLTNALLHGPV